MSIYNLMDKKISRIDIVELFKMGFEAVAPNQVVDKENTMAVIFFDDLISIKEKKTFIKFFESEKKTPENLFLESFQNNPSQVIYTTQGKNITCLYAKQGKLHSVNGNFLLEGKKEKYWKNGEMVQPFEINMLCDFLGIKLNEVKTRSNFKNLLNFYIESPDSISDYINFLESVDIRSWGDVNKEILDLIEFSYRS